MDTPNSKSVIVGINNTLPVLRITLVLDSRGNVEVKISRPITGAQFISILSTCISKSAESMIQAGFGIVRPNGGTPTTEETHDNPKDNGEETKNDH